MRCLLSEDNTISEHRLIAGDGLVIVDVQNDFLPGGRLAVADGDEVIPPLNRTIAKFVDRGLPVVATRDWHPRNHCSFQAQGGVWPEHCVAGTPGAEFHRQLRLPSSATVIAKATAPDTDAYSGFQGTELEDWLHAQEVTRLVVGGLATDYCVKSTVEDALKAGFDVVVLEDAVRAVDLHPGDGVRALATIESLGARRIQSSDL